MGRGFFYQQGIDVSRVFCGDLFYRAENRPNTKAIQGLSTSLTENCKPIIRSNVPSIFVLKPSWIERPSGWQFRQCHSEFLTHRSPDILLFVSNFGFPIRSDRILNCFFMTTELGAGLFAFGQRSAFVCVGVSDKEAHLGGH